jgi:hypothetical protein
MAALRGTREKCRGEKAGLGLKFVFFALYPFWEQDYNQDMLRECLA